MYGENIGTLKVLTMDSDGTETELWSLSGNQGNMWLEQMLSVQTDPKSKVKCSQFHVRTHAECTN